MSSLIHPAVCSCVLQCPSIARSSISSVIPSTFGFFRLTFGPSFRRSSVLSSFHPLFHSCILDKYYSVPSRNPIRGAPSPATAKEKRLDLRPTFSPSMSLSLPESTRLVGIGKLPISMSDCVSVCISVCLRICSCMYMYACLSVCLCMRGRNTSDNLMSSAGLCCSFDLDKFLLYTFLYATLSQRKMQKT